MTNLDHDPVTGEVIEAAEGELILPSPSQLVVAQEIDTQVATARRFPRRKDREIANKIMDRAVLTPDIAAECLYTLPRDNKKITGPSIRFAEIVRSCYGNIRVASRFVRIDADDKMRQAVIVEGVAMDVEMNDAALTQVRRSIMTSAKEGRIPRAFSVDMIATTVQAAMSIAERNAILKLVPKAIWIDALSKVQEVVRGTAETLIERRAKMLDAFAKMDVRPENVFAALGVEDATEIGLNDMPQLIGMWNAIKDGESVESVLGMAANRRRGDVRPVDDPMGNDPPGASAETAQKADKPPPRPRGRPPKPAQTVTAANSQAKPEDLPPETSEQAIEEETTEIRDREAESAQEAREAAGSAGNENLSAYSASLKFVADFKGSAGELLDWWRRLAGERAKMTFEETGHLGKVYNAKFTDLNR